MLFYEKLVEWVVEDTPVDEVVDHFQEWLDCLREDVPEKVDGLEVRFAAHQNLVQIIEQMRTTRKLSQPLLISDLFEIVLELLLQVVHRELAILVFVLSSVEEHLKLLELFLLLLALAHLHLHLLLLSLFDFYDILDEFLREANRGEQL